MNKWGIPNWRDPASYGDTTPWSLNRWRWEFLRRRDDVRKAFQKAAKATYAEKLALANEIPAMFPDGVLQPNQAGFQVGCSLARENGLGGLPNPSIGGQPYWAIGFSDWPEQQAQFYLEEPPSGFVRFDFDLSKPINAQLDFAKKYLSEIQIETEGKAVQNRRRPEKWLEYLRVMDARESGASWSETAMGVFPDNQSSVERARKSHKTAVTLCYNF